MAGKTATAAAVDIKIAFDEPGLGGKLRVAAIVRGVPILASFSATDPMTKEKLTEALETIAASTSSLPGLRPKVRSDLL